MGRFDWFWKAMGDRSSASAKRGKAVAEDAARRVEKLSLLSDEELAAHARDVLSDGTVRDAAEFLAVLDIAATRTLSMTPFPAQTQAVQRLMAGDVIQMATGEGKTLVGAMAATGFALMGRRVHVITVNDYLAARDAQWMAPLVEYFGLTVGSVTSISSVEQRREVYARDIIYAPVNEIGFDHLRDQQITDRSQAVQQAPDVALVDEADSVLVDEALVPLVLAGNEPGRAPTGQITDLVRQLREGLHFTIDDERRNAFLTEEGARVLEEELGEGSLYGPSGQESADDESGQLLSQVNLALHARALLTRDVDYLVRDGKIQLIDSAKGRVADLQRWPDGLHAAVEAKEGLTVTEGGRILDTVTLQALMRGYPSVCGMTGTAVEATDQLRQFYDLKVSVIDRVEPLIRVDEPDRVYATGAEKEEAILNEVRARQATGQPVLVGTSDVAESERLAQALSEAGVAVSVLNAKNDEEEAAIIADAGDIGRVTVSTQMAGRGTDIRLGGADESDRDAVVDLGGLVVIGTTRHRTARLDNQLRGRSGRQGDPGASIFFVALDDDIVATGGAGEKVVANPGPDGEITDARVRDFVEHCQRVTEGQLLEIHAQTWRYNQLLADQRRIIDDRRARLLDTDLAWEELSERAPQRAEELADLPDDTKVIAARDIMLRHLDRAWSDHLALLDEVRESIHLRAIARETPVDEFHRIAVREFKNLAQRAVDDSVETFSRVRIDAAGVHLDDEGLARPSATWTYMVSDNPLSSQGSLSSSVGGKFLI